VKEGPAIFYHDGCMIQAPHGCFYYWTYGFPGHWLSRGSLNTLLHSRLNKTIHFSDCCCMVHWIFMILSRISILNSCYLSSFQSCRSFQCIMSVVPIMSHYFSFCNERTTTSGTALSNSGLSVHNLIRDKTNQLERNVGASARRKRRRGGWKSTASTAGSLDEASPATKSGCTNATSSWA
jgi:hypothetical protein